MERFFLGLFRYFSNKRLLFFSILLIGGCAALYLASKITFEEDISKSLSGVDDKITEILKQSRFANQIILNVTSADSLKPVGPDSLAAFSDELTDSLQNKNYRQYISGSTFKINESLIEEIINSFYENLPIFLNDNDYLKIDSLIQPDIIDRSLEYDYKTLISPSGLVQKRYILQDPLGIASLALVKLRQFQVGDSYEIYEGYIFTKNRKNLFLFINPANPSTETYRNAIFFRKLDNLLNSLSIKNDNNIKVEYYGSAAVAVGNADQIKNDVALTVTAAIIIILLFVGWYFRKAAIPFISFLPAVFGGITALAVLFILRGKMSTIALGIGSVLLGIIVDYALYIYSNYKVKGSMHLVIRDMTMPIIVCSGTTAVVFFSLLFVKSEVLRDLGLFAGISILGAAVFSVAILPHLIKSDGSHPVKVHTNLIDRIAEYNFDSKRYLILFIVLVTLVFFLFFKKETFETDMHRMNFLSGKMKVAEKNLRKINDLALNSVYVFSTGKNLSQALSSNAKVSETLEKLKNKNIVKTFSDVSSIFISDSVQKIRIAKWRDYWSAEKRENLQKMIIRSGEKYGFKKDAFNKFHLSLSDDIQPVDIGKFDNLRNLFLNDLVTENKDFSMVMSLVKVNDEDRRVVYSAFKDQKNQIVVDLLQITTGFVSNIKTDFDLLVKLCLIFVTLALILAFGRIELGIIASVPMFVSWLWTLGFMGVTGIKFNIFNIIVSTFVFGLGVDYSILMMRGLLLEYKYGVKELSSYKVSILLSSFTTVIGVGVLILAKHPSLNSIALVSVIGLVSVVFVSFTLEPVLFRWLILKNGRKREIPVTLSGIFYAVVAHTKDFRKILSNPSEFFGRNSREKYHNMKSGFETPKYFRRKLIGNYVYKGAVLEWNVRSRLRREKYFEVININIPREASIVHIGCGYGLISYVLNLTSEKRRILGIDQDSNEIKLANNCVSKNDRISFVTGDPLTFSYPPTDVFLVNDNLNLWDEVSLDLLLKNLLVHLNPGGVLLIYSEYRGQSYLSEIQLNEIASKNNLSLKAIDKPRAVTGQLYVLNKK